MPLTKFIPKPMLKIKNKPILEHIIIKARNEGFKNFTIIVHHLKEQIIQEHALSHLKLVVQMQILYKQRTKLKLTFLS